MEMKTSHQYLFSQRLSREYPERMAIVGNGRQCTYEEMHRGIAVICGKLLELGCGKETGSLFSAITPPTG
jgi:non-ribosomal peptide synthetase component E (peptide arylation enzyme)